MKFLYCWFFFFRHFLLNKCGLGMKSSINTDWTYHWCVLHWSSSLRHVRAGGQFFSSFILENYGFRQFFKQTIPSPEKTPLRESEQSWTLILSSYYIVRATTTTKSSLFREAVEAGDWPRALKTTIIPHQDIEEILNMPRAATEGQQGNT